MAHRLPRITGTQLVRALERAGFVVSRWRGSHAQVRREESDGSITAFPVPVHAGRLLKTGFDADRLADLL